MIVTVLCIAYCCIAGCIVSGWRPLPEPEMRLFSGGVIENGPVHGAHHRRNRGLSEKLNVIKASGLWLHMVRRKSCTGMVGEHVNSIVI